MTAQNTQCKIDQLVIALQGFWSANIAGMIPNLNPTSEIMEELKQLFSIVCLQDFQILCRLLFPQACLREAIRS